jgi:hypothetical protein
MPDATQWSLPSELAQAPPRRCAYSPYERGMNAALVLLLALFIWLPVSGWLAARSLAALQADGVAVQGVVTDLATHERSMSSRLSSGGTSTSYEVGYEYGGGDGDGSHRRSTNVSAAQYGSLTVGGPVPVLYERGAPAHSALAFETAPFPGLENVIGLELLFCALALFCCIGLWRRNALLRRQKKLLMWGQAARMNMAEKTAPPAPGGARTTLSYSFTDARGETVAATAEYSAAATAAVEACATVLFDPQDSSSHELYPLRAMRVVV